MANLIRLKNYAELLPEYVEQTVSHCHDSGAGVTRELIRWEFPNGYGASLSCHDGAYGYEPEFGVLRHGDLCYDTDITSDVIPFITVSDVALYLARIRGF